MFNFKTDIAHIPIPTELNNPFGTNIPEIAQIAANEFQEYISEQAKHWVYDLAIQKGKMFGVLVIQQEDNTFGYLGAASGSFEAQTWSYKMVPNVFIETHDDPFISIGLTAITEIGIRLKELKDPATIQKLKESRKSLSTILQKRLFEETCFLNIHGITKNVLQLFENGNYGTPPAAAGECAAPKLLQFALKHKLKPIALAEFWWGNPPKSKERTHRSFYPACKEKCRPILEYMLDNHNLFQDANTLKYKV